MLNNHKNYSSSFVIMYFLESKFYNSGNCGNGLLCYFIKKIQNIDILLKHN